MEITHSELVKRGAKWLKTVKHYRYKSQIVVTEFKSYAKEIPDIFGISHHHTNVIECKVSLQDFKNDLEKSHRKSEYSLGNWRMYLCPAGLIPIEMVPDDWGLLYCHDKKITIEKHPLDHNEPEVRAEEHLLIYSIIRRVQLDGNLELALRGIDQRDNDNHKKYDLIRYDERHNIRQKLIEVKNPYDPPMTIEEQHRKVDFERYRKLFINAVEK